MNGTIDDDLKRKILINIETLVKPYLEKLKSTELNDNQMDYVNIIEKNLAEIISPFADKLFSKYGRLTPSEIQVANLIKYGRTNNEVAEIIKSSVKTIEGHRYKIRTKLGIKNRKINLQDYLHQLDN